VRKCEEGFTRNKTTNRCRKSRSKKFAALHQARLRNKTKARSGSRSRTRSRKAVSSKSQRKSHRRSRSRKAVSSKSQHKSRSGSRSKSIRTRKSSSLHQRTSSTRRISNYAAHVKSPLHAVFKVGLKPLRNDVDKVTSGALRRVDTVVRRIGQELLKTSDAVAKTKDVKELTVADLEAACFKVLVGEIATHAIRDVRMLTLLKSKDCSTATTSFKTWVNKYTSLNVDTDFYCGLSKVLEYIVQEIFDLCRSSREDWDADLLVDTAVVNHVLLEYDKEFSQLMKNLKL